MADVFDLELHENEKQPNQDSDDEIFEVDDVSSSDIPSFF